MSDQATVLKLYRDMDDKGLADMKAAFTEDREANLTRGNPPGVKFCDGRLRIIEREQARRKKRGPA